ncbi:MAG: CBS domain-containing protein [Magnetococcales bacterium]|nr:CBS domain-containing protein [Magnetococcales bacterium]
MAKLREWNSEGSVTPLLTSRIRDLHLTAPVILPAEASIQEAAVQMRSRRIDGVLVRQGRRHGILTSADIRDGLAIAQLPVDTPIAGITSWNLVMAPPDELLFKALLLMTKRAVNRLVIGTPDHLLGILGLTELLFFLTNHASLSIQRVQQATTLSELANAVHHQAHWVHSLFSKGMQVRYIGRLTRELDRQVFQKAASLLAAPEWLEHICILVMGSEGRGEQIVKTDQDNALIADDQISDHALREFAQLFTEALMQLGYPCCPGRVMMNNPQWGIRLSDFQRQMRAWIDTPTPDNLMQLAICYDARAVVGRLGLFQEARDFFLAHLPNDQAFYGHFAMPVLAFKTPLGIFKRFIVEKGSKQGQIDLKRGAVFPIVHGVRSLALEQKLRDPNTVRRVRGLVRRGVLERSFGRDLIEAFDFVSGLRIRVRLQQLANDKPASDALLLSTLGGLERENLRDCLGLVDRFKQLINHHFRLQSLR